MDGGLLAADEDAVLGVVLVGAEDLGLGHHPVRGGGGVVSGHVPVGAEGHRLLADANAGGPLAHVIWDCS